jgi:hypothetical protein
VSAFDAGIAVGALAGGWAVAGYSVSSVFLVGLAICIVALPVAWATRVLKSPTASDPTGTVVVDLDGTDRAIKARPQGVQATGCLAGMRTALLLGVLYVASS